MLNILDLVDISIEKYKDKIAFGDFEKDITFSEFGIEIKKIATYLTKKIENNEPVAIFLDKKIEAILSIFGTIYAGGIYSNLDLNLPSTRMESILKKLEAKIIITSKKYGERLNEIEKNLNLTLVFIEELKDVEIEDNLLKERRKDIQDIDPLYVNFTSGSTGIPKGVTISHRSVLEFIYKFVETFKIKKNDVIANQAPLDFDVSVKDIYSGIFTGSKVQLIPREYFSNPMKLMDYLDNKEATVLIWAVSAMCFVSIMNGFEYKLPKKIRLVMFSGEIMPIKQLNIWKKYLPETEFVNLYGPTEITCNCTYYRVKRDFSNSEVLPIGKSFLNEKVFLLNESNHEVIKEDEIGEICVSGTGVGLGYYNDLEKTKEVFVQNPLNNRYLEIIYRTGDLGKYNKEGELYYVSRKDFQIKHLGHRIELSEIDTQTAALDGVFRACTLYDSKRKKIKLFYTGEIEKNDLLSKLKSILPNYMIPNMITKIRQMPLNKNGKIDRKILEEGGIDIL